MLRTFQIKSWQVFLLVQALLAVLYYPARDAGWVSDTLGWLDAVQRQSFGDFINRRGFRVQSFYQTTQIATWIFFRLAGTSRLGWHLLHISLQALNAALLFSFFRRLLSDSGVARPAGTALGAVLLFALSPSLTEVIVWEAAYHYLQGLLLIILQLLLLQGFLHNGRRALPWLGGVVFAVATCSLELFYLSPVFSCLLLLLYRFGGPALPADRIRRASRAFLLPQLLLLALHLLLLRVSYGNSTGRLGTGLWEHPLSFFAIKPPDYVLHLLGGRLLPQAFRSAWHRFFCTYAGAGLFYGGLACSLSYMLFRFRRMRAGGQLFSWAWCATLAAMAIVTPMWFPERLLVMGDRYLYIMLPFFMLMLSLALAQLPVRLRTGAVMLLLGVSAVGVVVLAKMWGESERLTSRMQQRFPRFHGAERVLLLNNPANYYGIPMTGAGPGGEFALMRRLFYPDSGRVFIEEAFAAEYRSGGAAVDVLHTAPDRLQVTLRDRDRCWWYGPDYAKAVFLPGFAIRPVSGSAYELQLHPAAGPLLLAVWTGSGYRFHRTGESF